MYRIAITTDRSVATFESPSIWRLRGFYREQLGLLTFYRAARFEAHVRKL